MTTTCNGLTDAEELQSSRSPENTRYLDKSKIPIPLYQIHLKINDKHLDIYILTLYCTITKSLELPESMRRSASFPFMKYMFAWNEKTSIYNVLNTNGLIR